MNRFLLVTGDFTPFGGMDAANHALANFLASQSGAEVHLVTHDAWPDLASLSSVVLHKVPMLLDSYLISAPLLDYVGRHWAKKLSRRGVRVVVNGGNCQWDDVNWVHYVHAAYAPRSREGELHSLKSRWAHGYFLAQEQSALRSARLVICNSKRSRVDIVERLGVSESKVHVVYYGVDRTRFDCVRQEERKRIRAGLGWTPDRPVVAFVGALGDMRKGFDTLFNAWVGLCKDRKWDCNLVVMGFGRDLNYWARRVEQLNLSNRIMLLGFRKDVHRVLSACDALVHPSRYEPYGLGVHEALCIGIPAIVSISAGVAERYPAELQGFLIQEPENPDHLREILWYWRHNVVRAETLVESLSRRLRAYSWNDMASDILSIVQATS